MRAGAFDVDRRRATTRSTVTIQARSSFLSDLQRRLGMADPDHHPRISA